MRRGLALVVATALLLGGAVAGTGVAKPRKVKVERRDSAGYVGGRGGLGVPEVYLDEGVFETLPYERSASFEVQDRAGQPVAASVRQDADGDGTWEVDETFCGATEDGVAIKGGSPVVVKVQPGPCADGTPAVMTSGSIQATFTGYVPRASAPAPPGCGVSKTPREVSETYTGVAGAGAAGGNYPIVFFENNESDAIGGASFGTSCDESRLRLVIQDQSGLPVRAAIGVDADGPGGAGREETLAEVCGATSDPVAFTPGSVVTVYVLGGPCSDGSPAAATQGTITATFMGS